MKRALPVSLCLVLAGCGGDGMDDLRAFMETAGRDAGSKIEPLPAVKTVDSFVYRPDGLTDPFQVRNLRQGGPHPDAEGPRQPLEEFPLDALRMVGTLRKHGQATWAVILDPKGVLHTIQRGARIGQNHGKVTAIGEDGLEIRELIQDARGEWNESKAQMSIMEQESK
ncbi:MAG: pilus assembly protein PilP [Gallionellaceae bacterium]|nr:pilus assembly protein PilP [Gallionellaceae bacterium]